MTTGKRIALATLIAGLLDIIAAAISATIRGRTPVDMLRSVAMGPFPGARDWGLGGALAGLATHFAIMAVMAAVYVLAADRLPILRQQAIAGGIAYGLATWAVMNLVVLPLRWPALFPATDPVAIGIQLFCHVVLVGIPIALIARR